MRFKAIFALLSMVLALSLVVMPSLAQDDNDLSEDELAAIDRVFSAYELKESYTSYEYLETEINAMQFTIYDGEDELAFEIAKTVDTIGYLLRNSDAENRAYDISLSYFSSSPGEVVDYALSGQLIMVDDVLYIDNVVLDREGENAPELPEGLQVIASEEDIPEAYEDLGLDAYFDDSIPEFIANKEALVAYVSSVTVQQKLIDTEDGEILVDEITLIVDGDSFRPYFQILVESDPDGVDELLRTLFADENTTGQLKVIAEFTEDGNIRLIQNFVEFGVEGLDVGGMFSDTPEGSTMDWYSSINLIQAYTNINGEFAEIVAPE